jgi:hypothetical protein
MGQGTGDRGQGTGDRGQGTGDGWEGEAPAEPGLLEHVFTFGMPFASHTVGRAPTAIFALAVRSRCEAGVQIKTLTYKPRESGGA